MSKEQVHSVHLRNQHWYLSNWDEEGTYFTLGLPLPDIDGYNGSTSGRAPNEYKDILVFAEYHTSSGSKEEDPTDEQIHRSLINLSATIQAISTTSCPTATEDSIASMSIATAITTQMQHNPIPGGSGLSGGGPPGEGRGGAPRGGGGASGGGGTNQPAVQPEGKPMGTLPAVFKGDRSKAESFLREFSTYLLVNHDVPALASFI